MSSSNNEDLIFNQENTLYVGNLHEDVTKELIYELFIQFTLIRNMKFPVDKLSNKHQGYCLIELHNSEDVDSVIGIFQRCRGKIQLFNYPLKVSKTIQSTNSAEYVVPAIITIYNLIQNDEDIDIQRNTNFLSSDETVKDIDIDEKKCLKQVKNIFKKIGELANDPSIEYISNARHDRYINVHFKRFKNADDAIEKMDGNLILNRRVRVVYALKDPQDPKSKQRHGDHIERYLEKEAIKNQVISDI